MSTFSVVILRISRNSGGIAGLQRPRRLPHELVVDPEIGQPPAERAGSGADRGAGERHHEQEADQGTPEQAGDRTLFHRLKKLIELDPPVVPHRNDGIRQLDQIFLLHRKQQLAHPFRFFFAGEFDDEQIGQSWILRCGRVGSAAWCVTGDTTLGRAARS
jgi:hypothetical protein